MVKLRYLLIGLVLGFILAWLWYEEGQVESRPADTLPDSDSRYASRKSKDPLIEIDGIGPSYEQALNALGIYTFAQLAAQNADTLAPRMSARITAERIRREQWIEQARKLAG